MKQIITAVLMYLLPVAALAHGKWLVPGYEEIIARDHGNIPFYNLASIEVWVWIVLTICMTTAAGILHKRTPDWRGLKSFAHKHKHVINRVAQGVLGVFLIAIALIWNVVILPNETVDIPILTVLKFTQIGIGVFLILNIMPRYAAIALLILTAVVTISNGKEAILENIILFSLALYFYLIHTKVHGIWTYLQQHALDIVRIGTGVSLIVLAGTEKLLYPELGMAFLAEHNWNFMQPLFPWFSDSLFILSTGFAEMIFGLVFIFGYMIRTTTIIIGLFFAASVTTMLYQANVWEVEDFVVYCAAILLFFFSHENTTLPKLVKKMLRLKR